MVSLQRSAALMIALLACEWATAQDTPIKVCVGSRVSEMESVIGRLASALSKQQLRSGGAISGLALSAKSDTELAKEVQSNGCNYLVDLWPWKSLERNLSVPYFTTADGSGSPQPDATASLTNDVHDPPELERPALNYQIRRVSDNHNVAKGTQLSQQVYARHRGIKYPTDYYALAAKIVGKIKG